MTVKPTIMADLSVSAVLGAAQWNVNALQQARWTQEVLLGTNTDKIPGTALSSTLTLPGSLNIANDANFGLSYGSGPIYTADSQDLLSYDRTANNWRFYIGNVIMWQMDGNGKQTSKGIFDSGEVGIVTATTTLIAHGLGAIPRFVGGGWSSTSATAKTNPLLTQYQQVAGARSELQIVYVDATNVQVHNWDTVTRYVQVFAFL